MSMYGWLDEVKLIIGDNAQEIHLDYTEQDNEYAYFEDVYKRQGYH